MNVRPNYEIVDLSSAGEPAVEQTAELLVETFRLVAPEAWPDLPAALLEVRESLDHDRISRIAVASSGAVIGWVGGIPQYQGHVWELHPLAVRTDMQRQGLGRALVKDFERQVIQKGGQTIFLGTDDETGRTSLSGIDLYPNVLEHLSRLQNHGSHPYEFYQQVGFVIVGVIPDANGPGKPDILMAKRVSPHNRLHPQT